MINWNIVESGIKQHNLLTPSPLIEGNIIKLSLIQYCTYFVQYSPTKYELPYYFLLLIY
jgi:hypothetical protein